MSYAASEGGRERSTARAAIFVDYEDLFHSLSATARRSGEAGTMILEMIEALKRSLLEERQTQTAVSHAYADFTELNGRGDALQHALYLQGVESRFVPQSLQANAAEIQLCVDAMDLLHHRSDIDTFVLLTGSRNYLPLVQQFKRYGRRVLIVALEEPPSIDQVSQVEDWFFDARDLLSSSGRRGLGRADRPSGTGADEPERSSPPSFGAVEDPILIRGLEIIDEYFGHYEEVYLTPLLRKMSELLDERTCDPKAIVGDLQDLNAVRLEKRQGFPHDYTVLIVEDDHPDVRRVQQDAADREPYYYDDVSSTYDDASSAYDDASSTYDDEDDSTYDDKDDDFYDVSTDGRADNDADDSYGSGVDHEVPDSRDDRLDGIEPELDEDHYDSGDIRESSP